MEMYHNQWLTKVPEVKYTPLHWLGYWNDYHSIDFLLCQVDKTKMEHVETIMQRTSKDLTPLDIAARNKSNQSVLLFLNFFETNFDMVIDVFHRADKLTSNKNANHQSNVQPVENLKLVNNDEEDLEYPWLIYRSNADNFTVLQHSYARIFYWAAFYGEKTLCQLFLKKLGTSPFLKLFRRQNTIAACIKGG